VPYSIDGFVVDFALIHQRKLANAWRDPNGPFGQSMPAPNDPRFAELLGSSEIDYLILHPKFWGIDKAIKIPGYRVEKTFSSDADAPYSDWASAVVYMKN
jgi:hypothetical protein